jgi:hypothetical protein
MTEGTGGIIYHYSEGGISICFDTSNSDKELTETKFRRMLMDLIRSRPAMDVNRNCRPPLMLYPLI